MCRWFADYLGWVESPLYPHFCLNGQHCEPPEWPSPPPPYGSEGPITNCTD